MTDSLSSGRLEAVAGLSTRALQMARTIGERLVQNVPSPGELATTCQTIDPGGCRWWPATLDCGRVGLSLFYATLARALPGEEWERHADLELRSAAVATRRHPLSSWGTFQGTAGACAAARALLPLLPRYEPDCAAIDDRLASQVLARRPRMSRIGIRDGDYDAMTGGAGTLGHLIGIPDPSARVLEAVDLLLDRMVWFCSTPRDDEGPLWHILPASFRTDMERTVFPDGYTNLGLAHGLSGPLAALSLAWRRGHRIPGQQAAIRELAGRIRRHAERDPWGPRWPNRVVPVPERVVRGPYHRDRHAWCHGTPGVACALWQAGTALGDRELTRLATEGMRATLARPGDVGRTRESTSICHGLSGLVVMAHWFADVVDDPGIRAAAGDRVEDLLDACEETSTYLVRDRRGYDVVVDCPGVLMGAAGAGLALLSAAGTPSPVLHRCLLID